MLLHHERSRHLEDWELIQEQNITLGMTRKKHLGCRPMNNLQIDYSCLADTLQNCELEKESGQRGGGVVSLIPCLGYCE